MSETKLAKVGVVGGSGYAAGELLRILGGHPQVEVACVTSETYAGKPVTAAFPGFHNENLKFEQLSTKDLISKCDLIFLAQENGFAMEHAAEMIKAGRKVIDLSADFRLKDKGAYPAWYKMEHKTPQLLEEAVYGMPEINREKIKNAKLIANPGCYPTATTLAFLPLIEQKLIELDSIVIDAKSGVSGAGRSKHILNYHFPELNESVSAYGICGTHRHTPEIEQSFSQIAGTEVKISFTPHLIPITRGILSSCYARSIKSISNGELTSLYQARFKSEPFVRVLPTGEYPTTKGTFSTNQCHIGVGFDPRTGRVTAVSAIDNLVKGAAGQAVQNMNLVFGFKESAGLEFSGVWP